MWGSGRGRARGSSAEPSFLPSEEGSGGTGPGRFYPRDPTRHPDTPPAPGCQGWFVPDACLSSGPAAHLRTRGWVLGPWPFTSRFILQSESPSWASPGVRPLHACGSLLDTPSTLRVKNPPVEPGAWGGSSPLSPRRPWEPAFQAGQDPSLPLRPELLEPGTGPPPQGGEQCCSQV